MSSNSYYVYKKFANYNMHLDGENIILENRMSGQDENGLEGTSELIDTVPRKKLLKNSCKYAKKWGILINENKHIPYMNLANCN